jgi:hypothetical protein
MTIEQDLGDLTIVISDPSTVALSDPGEDRWGYHQFPTISSMPDGRLLATVNAVPDRDDCYGTPGPAFVSGDEGQTWKEESPEEPSLSISHSVISEVLEGEFLSVPMSRPLSPGDEGVELPEVLGTMDVYGEVRLYDLGACSGRVRDYMHRLPAARWMPSLGSWRREMVEWDTRNALVRTRKGVDVITRPYVDNRIIRSEGRLYYADYHLNLLLPDGSCPKNYACQCMVSDDNGRSWHRHGTIAYDETGDLNMAEPSLVKTGPQGFACVIRCSDHRQEPMLITHSGDGGRTWERPTELFEFGVMPQALSLGNGVIALAFGRPGIHLMFSPDGSARKWTEPLSIIKGRKAAITTDTCGYTRLLELGRDKLLLIYSDFGWRHPQAGRCKAILTRRIEVRRR